MSTTIITPVLLGRYLKATGWIREERPAPLDPKWFLGNNPPVFGISGGLPMLSEVARLEGDTLPELCARLGMLASAELIKANRRPGAVGQGYDNGADDSAKLLILAAGLTPEAWESIR